LALALAFAFSCSEHDRDNPLDPKSDKYDSSLVAGGGGSSSVSSSSEAIICADEDKCGGQCYDKETQFCYNSKIGSFCGINPQKSYDPDVYRCKPDVNPNGIFLKDGITDARDNKSYNAVLIGTQTWMAENLNYAASGSKCGNNKYLSDANTFFCDVYGRLYSWATAMGFDASCNIKLVTNCGATVSSKHQGVCLRGWHIPSDAEWNVLMKFVDPSCIGDYYCAGAGTKLKKSTGWNTYSGIPAGTDDYGFAALPGGGGTDDNFFISTGDFGEWWSSTEESIRLADFWSIYSEDEDLGWQGLNKAFLNSVRCVKD
jgi:uncharacterized protein (TIGR02145 family)